MHSRRRCFFRAVIVSVVISILIFTTSFLFPFTISTVSQIDVNNTTLSSINISFSTPLINRQNTIPDIFDLTIWRHILLGRHGNQTLCTVPSQYQPIVNAYCRAHNREKCLEIPCPMIYLTSEFTKNIQCLRGGKPAIQVKPDWTCRLSPALEILSNPHRKASLRAEAYTPLTSELYGQALAPFRDPETSKWGLTLQGESIAYYPSVAEKKRVLSLFDITLGYDRRYFDLITDAHLSDYVDRIINRSTIEQVFQNKVKGSFDSFLSKSTLHFPRSHEVKHYSSYLDRAPILWINSNCDTPSNRTAYVLELMRHIRVDVRGKCGNPNWNQTGISSDPKVLAKEKVLLIPEYLFTIAIENSLEYDYVTEKLWQPLAAGSVPIYLGAPNIDEWLPCSNYSCIINLREFPTIRDAANLINELVQNRERYTQYHQWRNEVNLRPNFTKMVNYFQEANQHKMKCLICDMARRNDHGATRQKLLAANNPFNDVFPSLA